MKVKDNFWLRQVADTWVVLPVDDSVVDLNRMLTLKGSGAMLWKLLETGATTEILTDALITKYEVDREQAAADVESFLQVLARAGCIEND